MNFEENIDELRKLHTQQPEAVEKEFSQFIKDTRLLCSNNHSVIHEIGIPNIILGILLLLILSVGFLSTEGFFLYFFAFIFFVAGFFVGVHNKGLGLIFLFSHGGTGAGLMIASLLGTMNNSAILSDLPSSAFFYFGVVAFLFVAATIMTIAYNLSDILKKKKYYLDSILCLYFLGFLLVGLFSYLIKYL